ncbi:MAG TPA: glycosyltransferase [Actinomycetota bacterium]|nr:glycosyltransferase [Actinomycetota bacterium]
MRVCHVTYSSSHPGANRVAFSLHAATSSQDCDSNLITMKTTDAQRPTPKGVWRNLVTEMEFLPKRVMYALPPGLAPSLSPETSLAWTGAYATQRIVAVNANLVHLHWICGGLMRVESLRKLAGYPLVWTMHDMWPFAGAEHYTEQTRYIDGYTKENRPAGERGFDATRWVWERKQKTFRHLPRLTLVSPSRWLAAEAAKSALLRDRRVEVIHNGIDLTTFHPTSQQTARASLDLPLDAPIILFGAATGTASPRKGFDLLVAALKELAPLDWEHPPHLVTFGSHPGDSSAPLPFPATNLGHIDDQKRLALIYSAADVFVAPSRQENLATTVLESLASGTPVVAFDIGGMPDSIDQMRNGYLAAPFDTRDLAKGVEQILRADPSTRTSLARNARATAEDRFDINKQARRHIELYEELVVAPQSEVSSNSL